MMGRIVSSAATCGLLVSLWACGGYVPDVEALRLAAETGDVNAQYNLGFAYYEGWGIAQNYTEGVRWYRLAAGRSIGPATTSVQKGGIEIARFNLGFAYYEGHGVTQDRVLAYMWLSLTPRFLDLARVRAIAAEMTADEIAAAQSLANRCRESGYEDCGSPSLTLPQEPGRAEELLAESRRTRVIDVIRQVGLPGILSIVVVVLVVGSLILRRPQRRRTGTRYLRQLTSRQRVLTALPFLLIVALIAYVQTVSRLGVPWRNSLPVIVAFLVLERARRFQKPAAVAAITFASVAAFLPAFVHVWWLFGVDPEATNNIMIRSLLFTSFLPVGTVWFAAVVGTIVWAIARLRAPVIS